MNRHDSDLYFQIHERCVLLGAVNVALTDVAGGERAADGCFDSSGFVEPDDGKNIFL